MSNRLVNETSPYLLQHADNPVDWYPWGEAALAKASREDKPIFVSIGYSTCHWCHVMAHESFEDERVAAILNEHLVSVKVDREERPDLDGIYMSAVQALTGRGGWPLSVFCTAGGEPFYGGTYYPPEPRFGMPSFMDVLLAVVDAWRNRREELVAGGKRLAAAIDRQAVVLEGDRSRAELMPETLDLAFADLLQRFDRVHGGWGAAPKFPQPMVLEFLLRHHDSTGEPQALEMVTRTLEAMARGGMYDQLGGGFHRYSVDDRWTTPHFEKMLYDQAQLARVYLHAWQVTGDALYRAVVEETLDYVLREMTDPAGGFYAAQDADSEGEEGRFFLWTAEEIRAVLGEEAGRFIEAYGVTTWGNFEGKSILEFVGDVTERPGLAGARRRLFGAREERVHPARDDKVLASWNGLMLAAFAEAAGALGRDDYGRMAERNGEFLLRELCTPDGRVVHVWMAGVAKANGYLEDHAHVIEGLLELYRVTFDSRWYTAARRLAETMIERFVAAGVGFYDTSDHHERLITRPRELADNAMPSGNGMAASVLQRLAGLAVEPRYAQAARDSLALAQPLLARAPLGFGQWLSALDYALAHPREVAIVGDLRAADTRALLDASANGYRPHQVVAVGAGGGEPAVPLLRGRGRVGGRATAYVCVDSACRAPVTEPEALGRLLASRESGSDPSL
jgi:uncharacterized protein YyaL (SSP411 family)